MSKHIQLISIILHMKNKNISDKKKDTEWQSLKSNRE